MKDGSPVTAKATDTAGNTGEEGTANAGNNPDTTAPAKPTVEAKDNGSVEVTPPADADTKSVEVGYTDEAGTPKTATLTKGNDGNWTSNNPDVAVDPATGKATIPADKVKDGSPVTAKATDTAGNAGEEGTANAGNNPDTTAPGKPTIEAKMNGFVYITPPADEDTKSVEVHYIDEEGNPQTVTITKDADKGWVSSNPDNDIWLNSETGKITLLAHKVKDGSLVEASATDNQGNTGEAATENAVSIPDTYAPSRPEPFYLQDRSMGVTMPKEAEVGDSVVIKGYIYKDYDDPDLGQDEIDTSETLATLTKQQDGSWISDKPENVPHVDAGNDNTIIPDNTLKGFQHVRAYGIDPAGNQGPSAGIILQSEIASPNITVKTDGFVEITYPAAQDLKSMKVKYTDKAGTQKITMLTKGEDGNWTSDNPDIMVEPATGKAMISADKIQPGSLVMAKVFDNSGIISDERGLVVGKQPDTPAPSAPELIPSTTDGSVTMKVPDDAKVGDTVEVSIVPERPGVFLNPGDSAKPFNLTLTKNADGSWTSDIPTMLPNIEAGQNSTTIPQDEIKDGSNVTAHARNPTFSYSELVTAQAGKDTGDAKDPDETGVSSNTIDSNGMGSSANDYASFERIAGTINMGAGNDILEASSTDFPFTYGSLQARIDMGSGDDIVRTSGATDALLYYSYKELSIDGGDGFDTLEFVNRDGEAIITSISAISNFEKIDIKGTLNNIVNIQKDDVERNHSTKATVDDSGKSHNNVLIIDGDEGDKVGLNDISKVASSQVNYEGHTYHVYHTGSNELWIDSDIAVA
ncbi:Bacterial Ig-like domain (group 3) [Neisseria subflava]|uniref:Bacterial Ig-like domain (Group 3) n=1 Tax=Neisseria subflava TaxID=28449 RepID=A0A9X9SMW6_NEISU|nr:Bacterial Ig-like domain (group 3) [Neisseria subflava]